MRFGITLPQYGIDVAPGAEVAPTLLAYARRADELGIDAGWLSDHPFAIAPDGYTSGALEPLTAIAATLRATRRIELGTLVLAGTMRAASTLAAVARTLPADRLTLGIGAGWYEPEHHAFGVSLPGYRDRLAHLARVLDHVRSSGARRPRILVGGGGLGALQLAARYADAWNVAWDVPVEAFRDLSRRIDEFCDWVGRDPSTLKRSVGVTVLVAENERAAEGAIERLRARAPFLKDIGSDVFTGGIVSGAPGACAERIVSYGSDEVVVAPLLRDDLAMLELLAEEVAPLVRDAGAR